MNQKRFRAADQAVAAGSALAPARGNDENRRGAGNSASARRGFGHSRGRGRGCGRGGWTQTTGGRGGHHGSRRSKNEKKVKKAKAEELDPISASLKSSATNYMACLSECPQLDGPFVEPWQLWDPRSGNNMQCRYLHPIFHGIKSTMQQWSNISMHHWVMADSMLIWNVEIALLGNWYVEQNLPGSGQPICIRPWFWIDAVESSRMPACLAKAWILDEVVMISLSEGNEIPLSIWLDKLAVKKRPGNMDERTLWRYWIANDMKFNFAGLPDELKLHICSFLVSEVEVHPYERPTGRGAIARGERDPEPEVAQGWQIMEGLWWALPELDCEKLRCPGLPPFNGLAADFLLATNVFSFSNPQALKRFLDNMGADIRRVRELKLHFQYEDLLLLFSNCNLPLLTVPDDENDSATNRHEERDYTVNFFQHLLKRLQALNLTELKFHVQKSQHSVLRKMVHYGFVAWEFECHRDMQLYIFQLMASRFFHVKKLGVGFDVIPTDAPIHDEIAKIRADAMNHPESELKVARKFREEARLVEIRGEEEESGGGVRLPRCRPEIMTFPELEPCRPGLERAHEPVRQSEVIFPCTAHPGDKCWGKNDCIWGIFTAGRRREVPEEFEPTVEQHFMELEEWTAAEAVREAKKSGQFYIDKDDEREPSFPGPSPWLEQVNLLDDEDE